MSGNQDKPETAIDVKALTAERDQYAGHLVRLGEGVVEAGAISSEAAAAEDFDPVETALSALRARGDEIDRLNRQLAAQKGQTTKARNQVAVLEAEAPAKPRKFSALDIKGDVARELVKLIDDADEIELAFVGPDGVEVSGVAPRRLSEGAFLVAANGLRLRVPSLKVHGPAIGGKPYELAGYALLLDGELAALTRRGDVLRIGAGSTFELKDDVSFA